MKKNIGHGNYKEHGGFKGDLLVVFSCFSVNSVFSVANALVDRFYRRSSAFIGGCL
jgi:hypothetical protein